MINSDGGSSAYYTGLRNSLHKIAAAIKYIVINQLDGIDKEDAVILAGHPLSTVSIIQPRFFRWVGIRPSTSDEMRASGVRWGDWVGPNSAIFHR